MSVETLVNDKRQEVIDVPDQDDPDKRPVAFYGIERGEYSCVVLYHGVRKGKKRAEPMTQSFRAYTAQRLIDDMLAGGWDAESDAESVARMCEQPYVAPRRKKNRSPSNASVNP